MIYIYDIKGCIVGEMNFSGGLICYYVYGIKENIFDLFIDIVSGEGYWIFFDYFGLSCVVVQKSTGMVVYKMDHDEFGRVMMDIVFGYLLFGFVGGIWDKDIKFVRYGVRDYDVEIGWWTVKDLIRF